MPPLSKNGTASIGELKRGILLLFRRSITYGKPVIVICVGKIKASYYKQAYIHYLELIKKWRKIDCIEVKDSDNALPIAQRQLHEGRNILSQIKTDEKAILLTEKGENIDSLHFAQLFKKHDDREIKRIIFILGGPFGVSEDVSAKCVHKLSLSSMTFPHELARVMLMEQIFRAQTILYNFPYHH